MMPDLARHAGTVLGAYAVAIGLLALLMGLTWERSARARRRLADVEARMKRGTDEGA